MINIYSILATTFHILSIISGVITLLMCYKARIFHGKEYHINKAIKLTKPVDKSMSFEHMKSNYMLRIIIVFCLFLTMSLGCIVSTLLNPYVLATHLCVI